MSKLYQILEKTFQARINSNSDIIPYIKKLSEAGKFDEPKKVAAIAILLDRLGKLEDEASMAKSLQDIASSKTLGLGPDDPFQAKIIQADTVAENTTTQVSTEEMPTETTISGLTPENIADKLTDAPITS